MQSQIVKALITQIKFKSEVQSDLMHVNFFLAISMYGI